MRGKVNYSDNPGMPLKISSLSTQWRVQRVANTSAKKFEAAFLLRLLVEEHILTTDSVFLAGDWKVVLEPSLDYTIGKDSL